MTCGMHFFCTSSPKYVSRNALKPLTTLFESLLKTFKFLVSWDWTVLYTSHLRVCLRPNHSICLSLCVVNLPLLIINLFRVAVKQGNVTRVEEALDLEGVNPNIKVGKGSFGLNDSLSLHCIFRHPVTSPATHPSHRPWSWTGQTSSSYCSHTRLLTPI